MMARSLTSKTSVSASDRGIANGDSNTGLDEVIIAGGSPNSLKLDGEVEPVTTSSSVESCKDGLGTRVVAVRKKLRKLPLEWMCLSLVLVVVWGLLLLPIIYFHTDIQIEEAHMNDTSLTNASLNESFFHERPFNECARACRDHFFCLMEEGMEAICVPSCPDWSDYPQVTATAIDVLVIVFACVGLISAVGVLVIACLRRRYVFTFPSIFVFYETLTIMVLLVLFLLNYVARGALYCASHNLLDSIYERSTPFCTISGMVLYYCMLQLNLWWVFHVTVLFWKIQFPIHSLRYTQIMWRVHLALVILGLSLPLLPVLATVIHSQTPNYSAVGEDGVTKPRGLGFGMATFPPILCYTLDKDVVFFSFILPVILLMFFGITILLLTIWVVHKQHGLFRPVKRKKTSNPIGTAEKKLLLVFLYYFLFTVVSYTGFSLFHRKVERYSLELMTYFECEEMGHNPNNPCDRSNIEFLSFPGATAIAYALIELSPVVNFVFIINFQQLKNAIETITSSS